VFNRQFPKEADAASLKGSDRKPVAGVSKFDFRRPDRIPKSQVRAIHSLHDTFVRNLVTSLSAYLRSYLTVSLVSVEQLSYAEFLDGLPAPTCLVSLGLAPYDGHGIMELNPSLVFPVIELLLGGSGKCSTNIQRDVTEIEQKLLDGLFRIVLHDLREAWKPVSNMAFAIEAMETEPQLLRLMAPHEGVVSIGIELRVGDTTGMMNIALPSIVIKMMRQKFDQQWSMRRTEAGSVEKARMLSLLRNASLRLEARIEGQTLKMSDLLALCPGSLLAFDHREEVPIDILVNGSRKFLGHVVGAGKRRAFQVESVRAAPPPQGVTKTEPSEDGTAA
jgi:flagellar motor switch protein FliM